jgi:hypothetical protein
MMNDIPQMPDPVENNSFIPTLDRQGQSGSLWTRSHRRTLISPHKAKGLCWRSLRAMVISSHKALESGAAKVFANEIDLGQLAILKKNARLNNADKLVCCLGEFPEHLDFPADSFDGIYNARLLHFFDRGRIRGKRESFLSMTETRRSSFPGQ